MDLVRVQDCVVLLVRIGDHDGLGVRLLQLFKIAPGRRLHALLAAGLVVEAQGPPADGVLTSIFDRCPVGWGRDEARSATTANAEHRLALIRTIAEDGAVDHVQHHLEPDLLIVLLYQLKGLDVVVIVHVDVDHQLERRAVRLFPEPVAVRVHHAKPVQELCHQIRIVLDVLRLPVLEHLLAARARVLGPGGGHGQRPRHSQAKIDDVVDPLAVDGEGHRPAKVFLPEEAVRIRGKGRVIIAVVKENARIDRVDRAPHIGVIVAGLRVLGDDAPVLVGNPPVKVDLAVDELGDDQLGIGGQARFLIVQVRKLVPFWVHLPIVGVAVQATLFALCHHCDHKWAKVRHVGILIAVDKAVTQLRHVGAGQSRVVLVVELLHKVARDDLVAGAAVAAAAGDDWQKERVGSGKGALERVVIQLFHRHLFTGDVRAGGRRNPDVLIQHHILPVPKPVVCSEWLAVRPLYAFAPVEHDLGGIGVPLVAGEQVGALCGRPLAAVLEQVLVKVHQL